MKGFLQRILQDFMKKNDTWNIRRLVDESFVPSAQQTSILYCRLSDFRRASMTINAPPDSICDNHTTPSYEARISNGLSFSEIQLLNSWVCIFTRHFFNFQYIKRTSQVIFENFQLYLCMFDIFGVWKNVYLLHTSISM